MDAYLEVAIFLPVGFFLLTLGGSKLVGGSGEVARRMGIRPIVIGLSIVAWATSAPELVVSGMAAYSGEADISLGNVLGSNVANIGLVLGASGLVLPAILAQRMAFREIFWISISIAALWWVCLDESVERLEAGLLLLLFLVYNAHVLITARTGKAGHPGWDTTRTPWRDVLIGTAAVLIGAKLVVDGAQVGARLIGISDRVVGLTVVAFGTSLPELAASLTGAFRGQSEISLGNVVGSNVFNSLVVIGVIALYLPFNSENPELGAAIRRSLDMDFPIVAGFTFAVILIPFLGKGAGRLKALALVGGYAGYCVYLYYSSAPAG